MTTKNIKKNSSISVNSYLEENTSEKTHGPSSLYKLIKSSSKVINFVEPDLSQGEKNPFKQSLNTSMASTSISSNENEIKNIQSKIESIQSDIVHLEQLLKENKEMSEKIEEEQLDLKIKKLKIQNEIENDIARKESLEEIMKNTINDINNKNPLLNDDITIYIEDIESNTSEQLISQLGEIFGKDENIDIHRIFKFFYMQRENSTLSAFQISNNFITSLADEITVKYKIPIITSLNLTRCLLKTNSLIAKIEKDLSFISNDYTVQKKALSKKAEAIEKTKNNTEEKTELLKRELNEFKSKLESLYRYSINSVSINSNTPKENSNTISSFTHSFISKPTIHHQRSQTPVTISSSISSLIIKSNSFCYFKFKSYKESNQYNVKFDPLSHSSIDLEGLGFRKGYIDINFPKGRITLTSPNSTNFEIKINQINGTIVTQTMKDIITIYRLYRKYDRKCRDTSNSFQQKVVCINNLVKMKECNDVNLDFNDKIKAALCHYFVFEIVFNDSKERLEIVFINYEDFKQWLNGIGTLCEKKVKVHRRKRSVEMKDY